MAVCLEQFIIIPSRKGEFCMLDDDADLNNDIPPELEMALVFLEKAQQDLVASGKWLADVDISDEIIGFHIQQAIEKSIKAVLLYRKIDYPRTHNLRLLIHLCRGNNIEVPSEFSQADVFNRFAVEWRYDLLPSIAQSALNRDPAHDLANRIWGWANQLIKGTIQ
jgi:HEPN domain-containing protein